jgi:hypothetical protein
MWIALPLLAGSLLAQQVLPVGVTRGSLVAWQGSPTSGSVVVRRSDGELYGCSFDAHTLFQRNQWPVRVDALQPGEPVEVLSDRKLADTGSARTVMHGASSPVQAGPGPVVRPAYPEGSATNCYARMLSVVYVAPVALGHENVAVRRQTRREPPLAPALRGYLTFSGMVLRADASAMTIRTREGDRTLLLRGDTRYSENGIGLEDAGPLVNRHVFVRGGRTLAGEVEAYQVMWGEIFEAQ